MHNNKCNSQFIDKSQECDSISERQAYMKDALLFQLSMQQKSKRILHNQKWSKMIDLDSTYLIFRYSDKMCQSCLDSDLALISEWENMVGKGRVLILPCIDINRNNIIKVKSLLSHFKYSLIPDTLLEIPMNDDGILCRYFGLLDNEKNIKEIYFPNEDRNITAFYLHSLIDRVQ